METLKKLESEYHAALSQAAEAEIEYRRLKRESEVAFRRFCDARAAFNNGKKN